MEQITSKEQLRDLWLNIYNLQGKADWSVIIPYYSEDIVFKDTVQEIHGLQDFKAMTERLAKRSKSLEMNIENIAQNDNVYFIEWIMTLRFKRAPKSSIYGMSRVTLNDQGKIINQRDYYDLWGDIYDNIPLIGKIYRKIMKVLFG